MLYSIPPEILLLIASYLPRETVGALAQTCRHCHHSILPIFYAQVSIADANHLVKISRLLQGNDLWSARAKRHVKRITLAATPERLLSKHMIACLLNDLLSGWEMQEQTTSKKKEKVDIHHFARLLLTTFPKLSRLVLEYDFLSTKLLLPSSEQERIEQEMRSSPRFYGSLKLYNYRPGGSDRLQSFLAPFSDCSRLTIHTRPYLSWTAAIQDSLLTNSDISALSDSNLAFPNLTHLDLAYVDDCLSLDVLQNLLLKLPRLESVSMEWLLPPSASYYNDFCQCMADTASLYPGVLHRLPVSYSITFSYKHSFLA